MANIPHRSFLQQEGPPTLSISYSPGPSITLGLEMLGISYTSRALADDAYEAKLTDTRGF